MKSFAFDPDGDGADNPHWRGRENTNAQGVIAPFPVISPSGEHAKGAFTMLERWIDNDVYTWLKMNGNHQGLLDEDCGVPVFAEPPAQVQQLEVKQEKKQDAKKADSDIDGDSPFLDASASLDPEDADEAKLTRRQMRIRTQLLAYWEHNQTYFYSHIRDAVKRCPYPGQTEQNPGHASALKQIEAISASEKARGSLAIQALRTWINHGKKIDRRVDKDHWYKTMARDLISKFPQNLKAIAVQANPLDTVRNLRKALGVIDEQVEIFRRAFADEADPSAVMAGYVPESVLVDMLRNILPSSSEWMQVKANLMEGKPASASYDAALVEINQYVTLYTSAEEKEAIHQLMGEMQDQGGVVAIPAFQMSGKSSHAIEENRKRHTGTNPDTGAPYVCQTQGCPNPQGHKSPFWGCSKYSEWKAAKDKAKADNKGNGGGRGGNRNGRGGRGNRNHDRGKGGGGKGGGGRGNGNRQKKWKNRDLNKDQYEALVQLNLIEDKSSSGKSNSNSQGAANQQQQAQQQPPPPPPLGYPGPPLQNIHQQGHFHQQQPQYNQYNHQHQQQQQGQYNSFQHQHQQHGQNHNQFGLPAVPVQGQGQSGSQQGRTIHRQIQSV